MEKTQETTTEDEATQIREELTAFLDLHGETILDADTMTKAEKVGYLFCLTKWPFVSDSITESWPDEQHERGSKPSLASCALDSS